MKKTALYILTLLVMTGLAACGKVGELQYPAQETEQKNKETGH